jgi:lysophospholipase L1-like esterase
MNNSRRDFIKKTGIASLGANAFSKPFFEENIDKKNNKKGLTILFQGDSITDGNRTRNNDWNHVLGHGYQFIIASKLWYENPKTNLMFYNRGISGNKITDLENRWQNDAIDLKPDLLSILIGVNDTASVVNNQNPQSIETFEKSYRNILEKTKTDLPNVQLVLCEPFILKLGHVEKNTEIWETEIKKRQEITKNLATEFNAIFVPFQQLFIDACKKAETKFWIWDGIHPMPAGHELMARQWLKIIGKKIKF